MKIKGQKNFTGCINSWKFHVFEKKLRHLLRELWSQLTMNSKRIINSQHEQTTK